MTRLVLHIGHPKTGTTALQFALAANAPMLKDLGILYPSVAGEHKHAVLGSFLMNVAPTSSTRRRTKLDEESLTRLSRELWDSVRAEIAESRPKVIVLSAESFWTRASVEAASSFHRNLSDVASDIQVVGYLRSPPQRHLSRLNQKVRMVQRLPKVDGSFYRHTISAYTDAGFEEISLQVFDKSFLRDGDIVTDFCQRFLPELEHPLDTGKVRRTNESISTEALAVMREVTTSQTAAAFVNKKPARRTRILKALREFDRQLADATQPQLHPRIRDAVIAGSTDLTWLRDEWGIEFPDLDYDLVGRPTEVDLESLQDITSLCPLNSARAAEMRQMLLVRFPKLTL